MRQGFALSGRGCWLFAICIAAITGCTPSEQDTLQLTGKAPGYEGKLVSLIKVEEHGATRLLLDTVRIDSAGFFTLKSIINGQPWLQLDIAQGPQLLLVGDGPNISLIIDKQKLPAYSVTGSVASKEIADFTQSLRQNLDRQRNIDYAWQIQLEQQLPDSPLAPFQIKYRQDSLQVLAGIESQLLAITSPKAAAYAWGVAAKYLPQQRREKISRGLSGRFKDSSILWNETAQPADSIMEGNTLDSNSAVGNH